MIERIEINLLPVEYRVHHTKVEIKREVAYPLFAAGIVAIVLTLLSIGIKNTLWMLRNDIKMVQGNIEKNRPIQNEINQLRNDNKLIVDKIKALELINVNREKWVILMEELSQRLPDYTWLVSIREEVTAIPVIHIEGRTYLFPAVANYMSNLKECKFILSVDLSEIEQVEASSKLYKFSISCAVNPEAYIESNAMGEEIASSQTGE